jgi:hypothetical protein
MTTSCSVANANTVHPDIQKTLYIISYHAFNQYGIIIDSSHAQPYSSFNFKILIP